VLSSWLAKFQANVKKVRCSEKGLFGGEVGLMFGNVKLADER